jgi:ribonuclease HI
MSARMTLYFDGGARPDAGRTAPGRMEIAVVTHGQTYIALRYAVEIAHAAGARDVLFVGDARTIVEQALGTWRCRSPQLQPHLAAYREAVAGFARVHVRHVGRSKNLAGAALARRHPR